MKKTVRWSLLLLLAVNVVAGQTEATTLRVGIFPFEPMNFMNEGGVAEGLNADLLREIVRDQDQWDIAFVPISWAEGLEKLQSEEIDLMVSVAQSPTRARTMDFNRTPVAEVWGQVFLPSDKTIEHISELKSKRVGVMRRDISGDNFKDLVKKFGIECEFSSYATHDAVFRAIQSGEVDAGIAPNHFGLRHGKKHDLKGSSIQFSPFSLFFAAKKGRQQEFLAEIDFHLGRWKHSENSYYKNRVDYWLNGQRGWAENVPLWLWISIGTIGGGGLLLLAINRILHYRVDQQTRELRELSSRQVTLLAAIPDIVVEVDLNKRYIWTNPAGYDFFGTDVIGKEAAFFFEGEQDTYEKVASLFQKNDDQQTLYIESWQRRQDGEIRLLAWWCRSLLDKNGHLIGTLSTARDITDKKQLEEQIVDSEKRLTMATEAGRIGVWDRDVASGCQKWNAQMYQICGVSESEFDADFQNWIKFIHPEDLELLEKELAASEAGEKEYDTEFRIIRPDGEIRHIRARGEVIRAKDGSPLQMIGINDDITERKQAAEMLRKNEAKQSKMVANIGDVIVIIDENGINRYKSPNITQWFGWKAEEVVGCSALDNLHPDDMDLAREFISDLMSEPNRTLTLECRHLCKDNSYKWIEFSGINLLHDSDIKGILGNYHDITERREMQERILKSEKNFRGMIESLPLAIYLSSDLEQVCDYMNPAFTKLFGYTLEDVPSVEHWFPKAYPDDAYREEIVNEWNQKVQQAIKTKTQIEPMETVVTCKDGSTKNILWGYTTNGENNYAYGLDLTERKQAEKELKDSEQRFRLAMERSPFPLMLHADDGTVLTISHSWTEISGYTLEDIPTTEKWTELAYGKKQQEVKDYIDSLFELDEQRREGDYTIRTKQGEHRIWEFSSAPLGRLPDGRRLLSSMAMDVTERRKLEMDLKKSEEEFRSTIEDLQVGIVVHAADSSILLSNPQARHLLGLEDDQLMGKKDIAPAWCFVNEDLSEMTIDEYPVTQVIATGKKLSNQIMGIQHADLPEIAWVLVNAIPIFTDGNELNRIIVNFMDITERKRIEEALRIRNNELERFNKAAVGRELRMIELKNEINALCRDTGAPKRYR